MSAARVLQRRVDWFGGAFKVALSDAIMRHFRARLASAPDSERVAVLLAGASFQLRRISEKILLLENADLSLKIEPLAAEGWSVAFSFNGSQMMGQDIDRCVELARRFAAALGEVQGSRVRRLDLCADLEGFDVGKVEAGAWVKPSRARLERASLADVDTEAPAARQFRRGQHVTGYSICPGNVVMGVIYDKREELTIRAHKRDAEEAIWREAGWDGQKPVGRVEFRFRGEALHELGARDGLDAFRTKLDALWSYACKWWLRLVELGTSARLGTCKIAEEWIAVQGVRFKHAAEPAARKRVRKGASPAQVFGACLSAVAGAALLLGAVSCTDERGAVLDETQIVGRMTAVQQEQTVRGAVGAIVAEAGELVVVDLLERFGTTRAAIWVLQRQEAARARFSSVPSPVAPAVEVAA